MLRPFFVAVVSLTMVAGLTAGTSPPAAGAPAHRRITTSPVTWDRVSPQTGKLQVLTGQTALARDANGNLHAIFVSKMAGPTYQYWDAVFTRRGAAVGGVSPVLDPTWSSLSFSPSLVRDPGSGLLLVFNGMQGAAGAYEDRCMYGATPALGGTWNLSGDGYSQECSLATYRSVSTTMIGSSVVTAWDGLGDGFAYHEGFEPLPVTSPDSQVDWGVDPAKYGTHTATTLDAQGGDHLAVAGYVWHGSDASTDGTYVWNGTSVQKAPGSGTYPHQRVAFVTGGTSHTPLVAYCAGTTYDCSRVRLWDVENGTTLSLPGSKGAQTVAASAGPGGRVWVAFYKIAAKNTITVARTNRGVTRFGPERTYVAPAFHVQGSMQIEGSAGRLDILISGKNQKNKPLLFHTQVLAPLSLKASRMSLPTSGGTITFTVLDAGQRVAGAKVSLLGKSGTTGPNGRVILKFGRLKAGTYKATAKKIDYAIGTRKIRVG